MCLGPFSSGEVCEANLHGAVGFELFVHALSARLGMLQALCPAMLPFGMCCTFGAAWARTIFGNIVSGDWDPSRPVVGTNRFTRMLVGLWVLLNLVKCAALESLLHGGH